MSNDAREVTNAPELREGQVWQCRDQRYRARVGSLIRTDANQHNVQIFDNMNRHTDIFEFNNARGATGEYWVVGHPYPQDLVRLLFDPQEA